MHTWTTVESENDGKAAEDPLENRVVIRDLFTHLSKNSQSIILAFEIKENGEPIMARSTCTIKEVRENMLVLHNFKNSLFLKNLKKGVCVTALLPYKQENKGGLACIEETSNNEITIAVPERLFSVRDIRIQPHKNEPIGLYILIPNEPTTRYGVLDISQKGIGFLCCRDLPVGSECCFTIMLPDPNVVVVTRGIIRHKKESCASYQYGAEFMLHPWDADNMAKYIMKREREIIDLLRGR